MQWRETAECFGERGRRLRGMLYRPVASGSSLALVLCPPFGEERKSASRVMTRAARALCREGISVLRFDYRGTGESDGDLENVCLADWMHDIAVARTHLASRIGTDRIGLWGIRLGAALAAMAPVGDTPLACLVMWAPLLSGRVCLDELRRRRAATRLVRASEQNDVSQETYSATGSLDLGGVLVGGGMVRELMQLDVSRDARPQAQAVVMVDCAYQAAVADDQVESMAVLQRLASPGGVVRSSRVKGRPFWVTASRFDPQPLVDCTLEQLKSCGIVASINSTGGSSC